MGKRKKIHVALFSSAAFSDAWEGQILPWVERVGPAAWQTQTQTAIVVPSHHHALFLRGRLLERRIPLFGLRFLTPFSLRALLPSQQIIPQREHLRLLLSIAAEGKINERADGVANVARAVARKSQYLLNAIEQIGGAGASFEEEGPPAMKLIMRDFEKLLAHCGFTLAFAADRKAAAKLHTPIFRELLITGFDAAHWPLWFLLHAATNCAENATVLLNDPREEARDLDEAWIGTWEETFALNAELAHAKIASSDTFFPDLFDRSNRTEANTHFLVGRTVVEQAEAITKLARHFIAEESAERIGILFPRAGALSRLVAAALSAAGIPHYDNVGHLTPGPLEEEAWAAWLELQENPRLRVLCRFLRASPAAVKFFGGLDAGRVEDILRRACREVLIDDLDLLRAICESNGNADRAHVAKGLSAIRFLPEQATLTEFLSTAREIFLALNWKDRWSYFAAASADWSGRVPNEFSRAIFLRWLEQFGQSLTMERAPIGDHPYSRIHLLRYALAENQEWSHLIFAGLNEGAWPPRGNDSGLLEPDEIGALNARIRGINRKAVQMGSQGEGHLAVTPGRALCLGEREQRQLAERQFRNLVESCRGALGLSANLVDEAAPERFANPSEFFTQLYAEIHGRAPSQKIIAALEASTAAWVGDGKPREQGQPSDIRQTALAFEARHALEVKFGEYEFALRHPLDRQVTLSATDWERSLKAPALVWLKRFLGVEAADETFSNWNLAAGQWVHEWLSHIAKSDGAFVERPTARDVRARVQKASREFRSGIAKLLGRRLPDWWISGWSQAAFIADALAQIIAETNEWSHFATEWTLPEFTIELSGEEYLTFRGRIDLLLARDQQTSEAFPFPRVWIIDYKTGRRTSLAPGRKSADKAVEDFRTKLLEGKGVQLALYALALHSLGAQEVGASLLTRELDLDRPQINIDVIEAQRDIWLELARMSRDGIFGMRGPLRAEFQFQNDYPLATLGFDPDFLEEKWNLTHPALPKIEHRP